MSHPSLRSILAIALLGLTLVGCATSPTGRKQLMLVSPDEAIAASKEAYVKTLTPLNHEGRLDNDPATTRRVKRITGRLIAQAIAEYPHTRDWEWSVRVIDDPETVNAWCMAGGKMAIYTGLLDQVQPTDDELAQVMGHEIAHALANHTAEKMSVQLASQVGMVAVAVAVGDNQYSDLALSGAALAAQLAITLPNSRTAETEADAMGIRLAAQAGYDPRAAATLWRKMGEADGDSPPEFLSTHPAPDNRSETLGRLAPGLMEVYQTNQQRPIYPL